MIDFPHPGRTTGIAAGIVNPVTGRRIAKSWRFEELTAFAKQTYREIEGLLGVEIWRDRQIVRALHNNFEENEWLRRSVFPDFAAYMGDEPDIRSFDGKIHPAHAWGELLQCAQVALPELTEAYREHFVRQSIFFEENFDYQSIKFEKGRVGYGQWSAKKIIFCEGAKAIENPFFKHLPFIATKGELLLIRIPGADFDKILKHHLFIVPLKNDLYWAGSTSRFEFDDVFPTEPVRGWLVGELEKTLSVPFEVVAHHAGVRPTVADLRPFLGMHPTHPELGIFNGLGTKGASMGPFFAKQMSDFLLGKSQLEADVDITRFEQPQKPGSHFFKPNHLD